MESILCYAVPSEQQAAKDFAQNVSLSLEKKALSAEKTRGAPRISTVVASNFLQSANAHKAKRLPQASYIDLFQASYRRVLLSTGLYIYLSSPTLLDLYDFFGRWFFPENLLGNGTKHEKDRPMSIWCYTVLRSSSSFTTTNQELVVDQSSISDPQQAYSNNTTTPNLLEKENTTYNNYHQVIQNAPFNESADLCSNNNSAPPELPKESSSESDENGNEKEAFPLFSKKHIGRCESPLVRMRSFVEPESEPTY